jgi:hypothetical protein
MRSIADDLVRHVAAVTGNVNPPARDSAVLADVSAVWALAHGLSDLLVAGRLPSLLALPEQAKNQAIVDILGRALRPDVLTF